MTPATSFAMFIVASAVAWCTGHDPACTYYAVMAVAVAHLEGLGE